MSIRACLQSTQDVDHSRRSLQTNEQIDIGAAHPDRIQTAPCRSEQACSVRRILTVQEGFCKRTSRFELSSRFAKHRGECLGKRGEGAL
eukprot:1183043-Prorocentrum_minimum.AAC.4